MPELFTYGRIQTVHSERSISKVWSCTCQILCMVDLPLLLLAHHCFVYERSVKI